MLKLGIALHKMKRICFRLFIFKITCITIKLGHHWHVYGLARNGTQTHCKLFPNPLIFSCTFKTLSWHVKQETFVTTCYHVIAQLATWINISQCGNYNSTSLNLIRIVSCHTTVGNGIIRPKELLLNWPDILTKPDAIMKP